MHTLTLLLISLISCYSAVAVHRCYKYSGKVEDFKPDEKIAVDCPYKDSPQLCESRETAGNFQKRCIVNGPETIKDCDQQNVDKKGTSCYHCDRELCNSGGISSASLVMASIMAYMVVKLI